MKSNETISVIVPAFNEERRIRPFLLDLIEFKKRNRFIKEIIVVDDGSSDATLSVLKKAQPDIRVISYKPNKGKGNAVKTGILAATGALVCFMDADGATPASQLTAMFQALQGNDVVVGNRKTLKARIIARQPLHRRFLSYCFNAIVGLLFNVNVKDALCGFKGMKSAIAKQIATEMQSSRWAFDVEIIARARMKGAKIGVIPIEWSHVKGSKMRIGLNTARIFLDLLELRRALKRKS